MLFIVYSDSIHNETLEPPLQYIDLQWPRHPIITSVITLHHGYYNIMANLRYEYRSNAADARALYTSSIYALS